MASLPKKQISWTFGLTQVLHMKGFTRREELTFPADMYLEGSDQYRGWFNSSITTSVAINGVAPYKSIISQGMVLDGEGRKMSKSLGNTILPEKVINQMGQISYACG